MLHTKPRARLLTLLAALIPLSLLAADGDTFTYTYEGRTISYTVISEADKTVQTKEGDFYLAGNKVSGDLKLPQTVYKGNVAYTLTSLGDYAFDRCTGLTSVTLPNSLTSIGDYAFVECSGLTSITLPESITEIGNRAFNGCSSLTQPVYNKKIFAYYPSDSPATSYAIPQGIEIVAGGAFGGCSSLTSITLPKSVTSIGHSAFSGCSGLTSITLPESLTSIGAYAFSGCSGLTSITLPEALTSINYATFRDCFSLTSVTIPKSVTEIGDWAFEFCSSLRTIYALPSTPPNTTYYTFRKVPEDAVIYVPAGSSSKYSIADGWSRFTDFREITESGIKGVEADENRDVDIYNIQGVCLKHNASQEDIDNLTHGLYIIAGKKVLVK